MNIWIANIKSSEISLLFGVENKNDLYTQQL